MNITKVVDFIFLVEHEDRERFLVQRIAEELKLMNCSSLILSMEFYGHLIDSVTAKCIVIPYAISSDTWPINFIKKFAVNAKVISLNWEQLLSESNKDFKKPKDKFIWDSVMHLAWSSSYKNFLEQSGVLSQNIEVIGNPLTQALFEFVNENSDVKVKIQKKYSLDLRKKNIFFPMNYGWAFYSDKTILCKIKQGYNANVAYQYRDYSQDCLERFCLFIKDLVLLNELNIIIRPHPSISVEQYQCVFNRIAPEVLDKIVISKEYTIKEWISISDIVSSSWSTSVWDAANIGKKVFLFTPFARPDWLNTWWNDLVPNIQSVADISKISSISPELESNPSEIFHNTASWLVNIKNTEQNRAHTNLNDKRCVYSDVYALRCLLRSVSMRFFSGAFVKKGMHRDFFMPIYIG